MPASAQTQQRESNAPSEIPRQATRVPKAQDDGSLSGWIEALGVDPTYQPPVESSPKPVACFYIMLRDETQPSQHRFHRAIYLMERSLKEFNHRVAAKWGIEANILKTIHIIQNGLEIELDDDVMRELKEGQDMVLELEDVAVPPAPVKREWDLSMEADDNSPRKAPITSGVNLRLTF